MMEKTGECVGYEIVCPDGRVRRYPYHNQGDAESDARRMNQKGCWRLGGAFKRPSPLELTAPKCRGGTHRVRPMILHRRPPAAKA